MGRWIATGDDRYDRRWALAITASFHASALLYLLLAGTPGLGDQGGAPGQGADALTVEFISIERSDPPTENSAELQAVTDLTQLASEVVEQLVENPQSSSLTESEAAPTLIQPQVSPEQPSALPATGTTTRVAADTSASSESGTSGRSSSESGAGQSEHNLREAYLAAVKAAINKQRGPTASAGGCTLTVQQMPGGHVTSASSERCALPPADRLALEAAALMAQPLPYAGYEAVFSNSVQVNF